MPPSSVRQRRLIPSSVNCTPFEPDVMSRREDTSDCRENQGGEKGSPIIVEEERTRHQTSHQRRRRTIPAAPFPRAAPFPGIPFRCSKDGQIDGVVSWPAPFWSGIAAFYIELRFSCQESCPRGFILTICYTDSVSEPGQLASLWVTSHIPVFRGYPLRENTELCILRCL